MEDLTNTRQLRRGTPFQFDANSSVTQRLDILFPTKKKGHGAKSPSPLPPRRLFGHWRSSGDLAPSIQFCNP
ncbi:hypothetical protein PROFUN_01296 [Planoprotostelium fungivorum]|uniref:Uncharacterized protein n=1 Tax=Planoprotostelium fungivorum TaxID=1890364 RepID=A0A2P6NZN4_9EUKA|nr:hypothetical protein PROFUN_01296 [Planoprotostelium fungivorum]